MKADCVIGTIFLGHPLPDNICTLHAWEGVGEKKVKLW